MESIILSKILMEKITLKEKEMPKGFMIDKLDNNKTNKKHNNNIKDNNKIKLQHIYKRIQCHLIMSTVTDIMEKTQRVRSF